MTYRTAPAEPNDQLEQHIHVEAMAVNRKQGRVESLGSLSLRNEVVMHLFF